jgi:hypothetical protein
VSEQEARTVLHRWLRTEAVVVLLMGVACLAGCGGGDTTYSASTFTECLQSRDANPTDLATDDSSSQQASIRGQLARQAREQNGAVVAFTNTEDPNESSISLLFFRGDDEAERAAQRVADDIEAEAKRQREKGLEPVDVPAPEARSNVVILDQPTEAQSRVLDECLERSSS